MDFAPPLLSQLQSAALSARNIFPSFTIGLAGWLAVLQGLWLVAGNEAFRHLFRSWIPAFAAVFCAAVICALAAPPENQMVLALVVATLILLAALLFVLLFGGRGPRWSQFVATLVLAAGSMVFVLVGPDAAAPERVARLLLTAYLATALLVASVAAWRLMNDPSRADSTLALRMAIGMLVACAPLEIAMDAGRGLRVGLALAGAILIVGLWGGFLTWRSAPERSRTYLGACVALAPASVFYAAAGWAAPLSAATVAP